MKLSIVIPAKNEERFLPKLLASIRDQSFSDYEVIVADASSTDRTREIAASFGARVVDGGMPGPGRNRGAEVAQGQLILFLDADVILPHQNFLNESIAEIEGHGLDIATCRVAPLEGNATDDFLHEIYNLYAIATEKIIPHAPAFCLFATMEAHRRIHGFDERVVFAEDHDYAMRAHKGGLAFGVLRGHRVGVSVRRLEKEGRLKFAIKYLYAELHIRLRGPMKDKMPFTYEFANYELADLKETKDAPSEDHESVV